MFLAAIPKKFYDATREVGFAAPPIVAQTDRYYFIDPAHRRTADLELVAEQFTDPGGPNTFKTAGLKNSARATLAGITAARTADHANKGDQ